MRRLHAFTLVELLVVMAIVATLLSIVTPRYFHQIDRAKEAALKTNLRILRDAIDKHYGDSGIYPASLAVLVDRRYLRAVPIDPITESAETWVMIEHPSRLPGVYDVRSAAAGTSLDGSEYTSW